MPFTKSLHNLLYIGLLSSLALTFSLRSQENEAIPLSEADNITQPSTIHDDLQKVLPQEEDELLDELPAPVQEEKVAPIDQETEKAKANITEEKNASCSACQATKNHLRKHHTKHLTSATNTTSNQEPEEESTLIKRRKEKSEPLITKKVNPSCPTCQLSKHASRRQEKRQLAQEKREKVAANTPQHKVRPSKKRKEKQQCACLKRIQMQNERCEHRRIKKSENRKNRQEQYSKFCKDTQERINQRAAKKQEFRNRLKNKRETALRLKQDGYEALVEEKLARLTLLQDHKNLIKEHAQKETELFDCIKQHKTEEARLQKAEREKQRRELAQQRQEQRLERQKFVQQIESEKIDLQKKVVELRRQEREKFQRTQTERELAQKVEKAKKRELLKQKKEQLAQLEAMRKQEVKELLAQQKMLLREHNVLAPQANEIAQSSISTALSTK